MSERLNYHLDVINTLPVVQSAYRWYHLIETVFTKVVSDITMAADSGDVSVLALSILVQHSASSITAFLFNVCTSVNT